MTATDSAPHDDAIRRQANALGDPTRHRIFALLADAAEPLDIATLSVSIGVHHNAVRQHLAKLVRVGLVVEATEQRSRPGRPRLLYTKSPSADGRWGGVGPYERLALLLTEIIRSGDDPVDVGRRSGRRERLGTPRAVDPIDELADRMARHGFEPSIERHGDQATLTLENCPFERAALADPDTICQLHLGLAYGIADGAGGIVIDELVPRDPRRAHCLLRCHTAEAPTD